MERFVRSFITLFSVLLACQFLVACTIPLPDIKPGEIPQAVSPSEQELAEAAQAKSQILGSVPLDNSPRNRARVARVVDKLLAATPSHDHWNLYILRTADFNAFTMQGNNIFVFTGLLDALPDDEMVAATIAHELGHSLARHVIKTDEEKINRAIAAIMGAAVSGVSVVHANRTDPYNARLKQQAMQTGALFNQLMNGALVYPHSRAQEFQADQIALFLLADAGISPRKLVDVMNFMAGREGVPALNGVLNTHPPASERAAELEKLMPMAVSRFLGRASKRDLGRFSFFELADLGNALYLDRQWKEANRVLKEALRRAPPDKVTQVLSMLAVSEARLGQSAKALQRANEALENAPNDGQTRYNVACMFAILGRHDEAFKHLRRALELMPSLAGALTSDSDLESLRDDPRFQELLSGGGAHFSLNS